MRAAIVATVLAAAATPRPRVVADPAVAKDPASVLKVEAHRYDSAPMELAATARSMLQEKGFVIQEQADPLFFETDWKTDRKGQKVRYRIEVVAFSTAASRIVFHKFIDDRGTTKDAGTDLDAEWALMSKIDPAAAKQIKADAPALPATPAPRRTAAPLATALPAATAAPAAVVEVEPAPTVAPTPPPTPVPPRATPTPKPKATPKLKKKSR